MIVVCILSQHGARVSLSANHSEQLSPTDSRRPIRVMASGIDGPVTLDSHSLTSGVIALRSGRRQPATTVHRRERPNGKDRSGLSQLSGP